MTAGTLAIGTLVNQPRQRANDYDQDFTRAYGKYYTRVFAFVYSRVSEVELSKDIVSEVFERAYRKGDTLRDKEAYRGWLFTIARNLISGHFRRHKAELRKQERAQKEIKLFEDGVDPEHEAVRNDRAGSLMQLVTQLSERHQELISLKFDGELTHDEIAKITGMTPGNVRVAIFRALKRLRTLVEEQDPSLTP